MPSLHSDDTTWASVRNRHLGRARIHECRNPPRRQKETTRNKTMLDLADNRMARMGICIAIALTGGVIAAALSIPLPYMLGAIAASMMAAMAGVPVERPSMTIVTPMRVTLGVLLGSTITPELLDRIGAVAGAVAVVPLFVILAAIIGTIYYERVAGYTREEAYFSALPGGLHIMTLYAEERGIDIRRVALAHSLRITFVVILTTVVTSTIVDLPTVSVEDATVHIDELTATDAVVLILIGLIGWVLGRATGLAGALMVVPMLCTAVANIMGLVSARPPVELVIAAQTILGANIGARFVGEKIGVLTRAMRHALGHVSLMLCLAAMFALLLNQAFDLPILTGMLSFAPGGMSEIGLIALALGLDVGFVATIQLTRLMSINVFGPMVYRQISALLNTK
ncbi:MAG: AbrB family transcriptional regulator [Pseudomonadota bacterium]